ncbi:hypothetical protein D778_01087 [Xanthomarina gelatinilytica]|uniref:Uncharacterized protein n=1 Tax=Xanthomarina gelatinilytica TaxID=1137281 RepID=M7MGW2_9FLAO|nr:hypothetical protein D778_01087 [Xanthomarina gelatinilytica]
MVLPISLCNKSKIPAIFNLVLIEGLKYKKAYKKIKLIGFLWIFC